jgi:hypothetical protein
MGNRVRTASRLTAQADYARAAAAKRPRCNPFIFLFIPATIPESYSYATNSASSSFHISYDKRGECPSQKANHSRQ